MADFLYDADGRPRGFRLGSHIYTLDGTAVGRVWAEKAYRLDGTYVGAILKNMVVDKPNVSRRNMPPIPYPGDAPPERGAGSRHPIGESFDDVFDRLVKPEKVPDGSG